jgi:hypothetical protein
MTTTGVMTSKVISDNGFSITPSGWRVDIRLPWYRSLPVSTVEIGAVAIDGNPVNLTDVHFELDGREIPVDAMADQVAVVWYVLDSAYLNVRGNPPERAAPHEVSITLNLYPPYIRGLKRMTRDTRILRAP